MEPLPDLHWDSCTQCSSRALSHREGYQTSSRRAQLCGHEHGSTAAHWLITQSHLKKMLSLKKRHQSQAKVSSKNMQPASAKTTTESENADKQKIQYLICHHVPKQATPAIELDPTLDIKGTADWMSQEGLDQKILNFLLFIPNDKLPGKTSKAFITQLKLFSTFSEMTPYEVMKALINDGIGHVMTLRSVADDAAKLVTVERELMKKHTKEKFPYLKILRLEGHERIVPQDFPNLFKAATLWKRKRDGTFREYQITKDLQSEVSEQDLEEALLMPPLKRKGASNVSYDSLRIVYGISAEEIDRLMGVSVCNTETERRPEQTVMKDQDLPVTSRDLRQMIQTLGQLVNKQDEILNRLPPR
ncbi:hypothetical protein QTO34_015834 [Cnephaeus nilssonii]|uniref:Uncharacterized protein n=1 Tax=Cnephaeus nilssonii TaxID=3371016 RepID=A0AA40I5S4_CNENI|nr:hypothetical protein QTO34_015834 [Eptesicus nilssonii]